MFPRESVDFRVEKLKELEGTFHNAIERYINSGYADTPEGQYEIKKLEEAIAMFKEEIKAYEEYKKTGIFISRPARELLKKAKEEKEASEGRKDEEGR